MKIPFNIKYRPQIESGEYKVKTKDGKSVRIICWDKKSQKKYGYHIVGLIEFGPQHEESTYYTIDGKGRLKDKEPELFIVTPEPTDMSKFVMKASEFAEAYYLASTDCESEEYKTCDGNLQLIIDKYAAELLALAREQLIKDGYVIEKKAFHDAVEKVDPEVMKEVSDNVDRANELAKKYLEGYTKGYKDAEKIYNDFVAYRNPEPVYSPRLTDILITPNTASGTSASTLHGNTSATDGNEHNPSFTD